MSSRHRDPHEAALEKLTARLARDSHVLRDALASCAHGVIPEDLLEAFGRRASSFHATQRKSGFPHFSVRG